MVRSIGTIALAPILLGAPNAIAQNSRSQSGGTRLSGYSNSDDTITGHKKIWTRT